MTLIEKKLGFNHALDFSWDLLLTQRKTHIPFISRVDFRSKFRYNSRFYHQYLKYLFLREPRFILFKMSKTHKLKLKNPFFKGRRFRRLPYMTTLTLTKQSLSLAFYFIIFVVLIPRIYTSHFGPYFVSFSLKEFNSYKARIFYEGPREGNWKSFPRACIYFNKENLTWREKLQFFSLIKIFHNDY